MRAFIDFCLALSCVLLTTPASILDLNSFRAEPSLAGRRCRHVRWVASERPPPCRLLETFVFWMTD